MPKPAPKNRKRTPKPKLLAGDNPQIAKAKGHAPVKAYIAGLPDWKRRITKQLDALIVATVPGVKKAVAWDSPLYSSDGVSVFSGLHMYAQFVRLTFFNGSALKPPLPVTSKLAHVRYFDVRDKDVIDEAKLARYLKQAAKLPGWAAGIAF